MGWAEGWRAAHELLLELSHKGVSARLGRQRILCRVLGSMRVGFRDKRGHVVPRERINNAEIVSCLQS